MTEYTVTNKDNVLYGPPLKEKTPEGGLGWFIKTQCEKFSEQTMQTCPYNNRSITFGDFNTQSMNLARNIQQLFQISKGDVILSCMKNSLENSLPIVAAFHLAAITAALDPTLSVRDCEHLVNLVKPKVIFLDEDCLPLIETTLENIDYDKVLIVNGSGNHRYPKLSNLVQRKITKAGNEFKPVFIEDELTPAVILFSSGTTGLPKGICLSQKSTYLNGYIFIDLLNNPKCILHYTTLYWISALGLFLTQFVNGCKRIALNHWDPLFNCQVIDKFKIDVSFMATSYMYGLFDMKQYIKKYDITSLKLILVGGSTISKEVFIRLHAEFPSILFPTAYGMSEVGLISGYISEFRQNLLEKPASSGRVARGVVLKIRDTETGRVLGPNEKGEFCIRTEQILLNYWNNTEDNPIDEEGFVKSGDVGHYDDECYVYIYDRIKDMFKYKSWNIVPASIETVIKEHANVDEAVVFGIEDETDGYLPSAAITLKIPGATNCAEIASFVAERVVDRQRLRGGVYIVEKIEKTPTGKIQRRKVQEQVMKNIKNYIC